MLQFIRRLFCDHDRHETIRDDIWERDGSRHVTTIRCLDCGWTHRSITDERNGISQTVRS